MMSMTPALLQAMRELAAGQRDLAASAGRISAHYRQSGTSKGVIGGAADAVAYALSRMPATYAAVSATMDELVARAGDFTPATLLDAGAGPGSAAWAAAEAYPGIAATLVDHNRAFLELAGQLGRESAAGSVAAEPGEIHRLELGRRFDLVTCAYALTELGDADMHAAADRLWAHSAAILVIVEPGRPRDYQRLMEVRRRLIGQGARVIAPCPHDGDCPLPAPDWCHFSVRLDRSRDHMRLKGARLGYEDEKFSYLILARDGIGAPAAARVLRRPETNKVAVRLTMCGKDGIVVREVASRDKSAFKQAKRFDWGDGVGD
jgi:ribosomal protein RSM22 (predicted rRNA methylase)